MSYCKNCGQKLLEGEAFCPSCGTPVSSEQPKEEIIKKRIKKKPVKKPKKKMKKGVLIGILSGCALLLAAAAVITFLVIIPSVQYDKALELGRQHEYKQAADIFEKLGDYKDSPKYMQKYTNEYNYEQASKLFDEGDFASASVMFTALGSFKDSDKLLVECEKHLKYNEASLLMEQENYAEALLLFYELDDFLESKDNLKTCQLGVEYQNASAAFGMQNYNLAQSMFSQLGSFKDSAQKADMLLPLLDFHETAQGIADGISSTSSITLSDLKVLSENEQTKSIAEPLYCKGLYLAAFEYLKDGSVSFAAGTLALLPEGYEQAGELLAICNAYLNEDFDELVRLTENYSHQETQDLTTYYICELAMDNKKATDKASLSSFLNAYSASRQLRNIGGMGFRSCEHIPSYLFEDGISFSGKLDELIEMCGNNADGKVLFAYQGEGDSYNICTRLMDWLPQELVPQNVDEVEYIVVAEFWDSITGFYDSGTVGIQEKASVKIKKCPSGKTVKTIGTVKGGKPPSSFTYSGTAPFEKRGSALDEDKVRELMVDAAARYVDEKTSGDYDYVVDNGEVAIVKYNGSSKTPAVPGEIDGMPVRAIKSIAFKDNKDITGISLPDSLTGLPSSMFSGFEKLESIKLPNDTVRIGAYAFEGCTSLKTVILNDGLRSIEAYAFKDCIALSNINIPDSVIHLGRASFIGCTSLCEVRLSENIQLIYSDTFNGCIGLKNINLPGKIRAIRSSAFNGSGLESITLPDSVEYIGEESFSNTKISEFVFSPNLKYIDENAFSGCVNLKELHLPKTVLWINPDTVFDDWMMLYVKQYSCAYSILTGAEYDYFTDNVIVVEN